MIFEFDWNRSLFVARYRGPKKRSGGGGQSPNLDIRRIAKYIYPMKLKFILSLLEYLGESIQFLGDFSKILFFLPLVDIYRHPLLNTFKVKEMICCSHIIFFSFLHQVLLPQTGVVSGLPCIFPFTYGGEVYYCCSTADTPNNRPWCPLVHVHSFYTGQAGFNWDYCRKFILKFGGCYRDLKTRINNACWDILTENEKMETFTEWMPDSTPFFCWWEFWREITKVENIQSCLQINESERFSRRQRGKFAFKFSRSLLGLLP